MNEIKDDENGAGPGRDRRELEMKITRQFRDWIRAPGILDMVFGPRMSCFERQNKVRQIMGLPQMTRAEIPPGQDWDTPEPRVFLSRKEHARKIAEEFGVSPEASEPEAPQPKPEPANLVNPIQT